MILCSLRVESGNDVSLIEYESTLEDTYKKRQPGITSKLSRI